MTLTQLAQKHNLEPESAKAFLREWFDNQSVIGYTYIGWIDAVKKHGVGKFFPDDAFGNMDVPLIARPTDLGD